ncbi:MAG: prepilin-type N-terminal cleavage/methylation domain-containing protein [Sedimentibacter sp.]
MLERCTIKNDGFTLIEIITVFSLIVIILAVGVPNITTDFGYMDKMVEGFLADVRYIQMEAMKYPTPRYQISVNSVERKYYLKDENKIVKTVSFKDRYTIDYTGTGELYFSIEGTPVHPGTFTIVDTETNEKKSVTIVPATGRTIILE